eukprot:gb/GFBE01049523.1/.p1 GENE.gb/GFBE01049523.1/~~gb/GFBE01049523.1/.p1  ORF type:complete len:187 (+),score=30.00 gb/GFBE01049523.1/:1-561(+)
MMCLPCIVRSVYSPVFGKCSVPEFASQRDFDTLATAEKKRSRLSTRVVKKQDGGSKASSKSSSMASTGPLCLTESDLGRLVSHMSDEYWHFHREARKFGVWVDRICFQEGKPATFRLIAYDKAKRRDGAKLFASDPDRIKEFIQHHMIPGMTRCLRCATWWESRCLAAEEFANAPGGFYGIFSTTV